VGDAEPCHRLLLLMESATAQFTVAEEELQHGKKLLKQAIATASYAGFEKLPRVLDPADLNRLPQIVQQTQLKPPTRAPLPTVLGFVSGRFHGPNFTSTTNGVNFRLDPVSASSAATCPMLPEQCWETPIDHLRCRANELATWLTGLEKPEQRMATVVVHAALAWLHRGSRGLPSQLLLPTGEHLDLLGDLIGVVPIDIGRGTGKHSGVPRLMRSHYWERDQFTKHGRLVAAIEDPNRRIDPSIPIVVHSWTGGTTPPPPTSVLSLLTHCVLGSTDVAAARRRLVLLVECPALRRLLKNCLDQATGYLAGSERYLDAFLTAVRQHGDLKVYSMQKNGKILLNRDVIKQLKAEYDFDFRETRLIDELRQRYPFEQPARYGREHIPVFRLPADSLTTV
jgi:hypothetical protein